MSTMPRHLVLFGFDLEGTPALAPHRLTALPAGLRSLYRRYDIFEADLVIMAPRRDLFAPPAQFGDAADLACEMAYSGILPPGLVDPLADHEAKEFAKQDAALKKYLVALKKKTRLSKKLGGARGKDRSSARRRLSQKTADPVFEPNMILEMLITCGTWLLRRSFEKGRAGRQDVLVFVPPCPGGMFSPAYEEHFTAVLMDYWLGMPQFAAAVPAELALKRLKWTPCAEALKWPEYLDLKRMESDAPFMQCVARSDLITAGSQLIGDESGFDLRHVPEIVPAPASHHVIQHAPLIASPDGSVTIGSVYQVNDLRIHVLPEPIDIADTVTKFVHAEWGLDPGQRLELESGQPQMIKSIGIRPCEPLRSLPALKLNAGDRRRRGWAITINNQHRVGMGETKFLQLLAFIAADRVGQAAGVSPARPRLGDKPIRNVFRPTDGCDGPEARRPVKPAMRPKNPNTALPKADINEVITDACQELKLIATGQQIELIVSSGEKGCYRLNPEYSSFVRVELDDQSAKDVTVKALIALVPRPNWNPAAAEPPAAERLWYQDLPVQLPSDLTVTW